MKQNLIIIKYPIDDEDLDLQLIAKLAQECKNNHPDHEFLFLPKGLEYEVIKNDNYEQSNEALSRCSEEIPRESNRGLLPTRKPELRVGDLPF